MSTGPALVVGLAFVALVGLAVELIAFRPLRTASPLGVLLIAQAAIVLAFGTTPQNEPGILPQTPVSLLGAVIPVDRFILTGIVIVLAAAWFPTSQCIAVPGVQELVAFVIIVGAMFLRGGRLPSRGDLIEQRLPLAPRPRNLVPTAVVVGLVCAIGMVVLPYDFRDALINTLIGTVMALSLVVLTGFVGQISVVQLTLAGVAGFVSPIWRSTSGSASRWRRSSAPPWPCCWA
jgi:hypothetical protein